MRNNVPVFMAAAAFGLSLFLVSCSTTPSNYRGSLSDAMDKAKDDHEGDRSVPDDRVRDSPWQDDGGNGGWGNDDRRNDDRRESGDGGEAVPLPVAGPSDFWIGIRGGNGLGPSGDMEPLSDGDIFAGGEASPNLELDLFAGYKAASAVPGSSLDESVKDSLLFLKAGFEGRYSPFSDWVFFSPYVSAGMGCFYMGWNFRNSLTAGTEVISSDSVTGLLLAVAAGVYPVKLERFRIGVSVMPETLLFGPVTGEGFDNDYFGAFNSMKVVAEIAVKL